MDAAALPVVVLIEPGLVTRLFVRRGDQTLAAVCATHGFESLPALIEMAAGSFDVDEWRVQVGGFQRVVLQDVDVRTTCERLGIRLEPLHPTPASG